MASDKKKWSLDHYKKKLKEGKSTYEERKKYLSSKTLRKENVKGWEDLEEDESSEETGNAVSDPGGIGNFIGSGELVTPAEAGTYRYTSKYGMRNGKMHFGIDLAPKNRGDRNTNVLAAGEGVVVEAGSANGFGYWIVVKHKDDLYSIYGHMPISSFKVKIGDKVKRGQIIAKMGDEGASQGVHLHFEVTRDFSNRKGKGKDGKYNTFDPEEVINVRAGASSVQVQSVRTFALSDEENHSDHLHHIEYGSGNDPLSEEGKKVDNIFRQQYPFQPIRFRGQEIIQSNKSREQFLYERIGRARTTQYREFVSLNNKQFFHQKHYDGFEGNLYSSDAKRVFESLILKTKKPYFEVVSGFRFSNNGQLSPHEAGVAIDILVKTIDEAREIADCAWLLGVRSIGIGGNFDEEKGFIHLDIAPKGRDFAYDGLPLYGGPGKWVIK